MRWPPPTGGFQQLHPLIYIYIYIYNENSIIILLNNFYYLIKKIIARDLRFKISLSSD
jgi:hypothetical protein